MLPLRLLLKNTGQIKAHEEKEPEIFNICGSHCGGILRPDIVFYGEMLDDRKVMKAVREIVAGRNMPFKIITEEKVYDESVAEEVINARAY